MIDLSFFRIIQITSCCCHYPRSAFKTVFSDNIISIFIENCPYLMVSVECPS